MRHPPVAGEDGLCRQHGHHCERVRQAARVRGRQQQRARLGSSGSAAMRRPMSVMCPSRSSASSVSSCRNASFKDATYACTVWELHLLLLL